MRYNTDTIKQQYSRVKEYAPVLAVAFIILLSVVAAGGVYTQPVGENSYGSVEAQTSVEPVYVTDGSDIVSLDPSDGSEIWRHSAEARVNGLFYPGGDNIYAIDTNDNVYILDTDGNRLDKWFISLSNRGNDIVTNKDETRVYIQGGENSATRVAAFDSDGNELWRSTIASSGFGWDLDISQNGEYLYASGGDAPHRLDATDGSVNQFDSNTARHIAVSRSTGYIHTGRTTTGYSYDTDLNQRYSFGTGSTTYSVESDKAGNVIYGLDGNLKVYDEETGDSVYSYSFPDGSITSLATSSDSEYIYALQYSRDTLYKIDKDTGNVEWEASVNTNAWYGSVTTGQKYDQPAPPFDPELEIDTRNYLPHNESSPYTVYYTNPETGNVLDVSDDSGLTVNSSNTSVFTLDETNNLVVATNDTSINQREQFTAEYEGLQAQENVTVANATVDNLAILPGITRVQATYTDSNIVLILVGSMLGVVATRVASAFAGLGALQLTLVAGFFVDLISLGVVLTSLFAALFIGLNMAANIDYTVRRG